MKASIHRKRRCVLKAGVLGAAGALWAASLTAGATTAVFRCPAPGSYSDKHCDGGRPLAPHPVPSADQQAQAQQVATREQALASQLRAERLARESQAVATQPAGIRMTASAAPPAKSVKTKARPAAAKAVRPAKSHRKAPKPAKNSRAPG